MKKYGEQQTQISSDLFESLIVEPAFFIEIKNALKNV